MLSRGSALVELTQDALSRLLAALARQYPRCSAERLYGVLDAGRWMHVSEFVALVQSEQRVVQARALERAELERKAAESGGIIRPDGLALPIMVRKKDKIWVRMHGSDAYSMRFESCETTAAIRDFWPDVPRHKLNRDGDSVLLADRELLDTHAGLIVSTEVRYTSERTTYDPATRVLVVGVPTDPDLTPTYHAGVDEWVMALGGETAREWIATARPDRLNQFARAFFLISKPGMGKDLLAHGLARIWKVAPVDATVTTERFNSSLAQCPILFANERLPPDLSGEKFREAITNRTWQVEPKGLEKSPLIDAVRFYCASNNPDKVNLTGSKVEADFEAIADRICYVDARRNEAAAKAALCKVPNDPDGPALKDLRVVAQHFLWIMHNVPMRVGQRFIGPEACGAAGLLRAQELEKCPGLSELLSDFVAERWAHPDRSGPAEPDVKLGQPNGSVGRESAIFLHDGSAYVRPRHVAALLGRPVEEVTKALGGFIGARTQRTINGARVNVRPLDLASLLQTEGLR